MTPSRVLIALSTLTTTLGLGLEYGCDSYQCMKPYPSRNHNTHYIKVLQRLHELMPGILGVKRNDGCTPGHEAALKGHVEVLQCVHGSYHGQ